MSPPARPCIIPVFLHQIEELETLVEAWLQRRQPRAGATVQVALYGGSFPALDTEDRRRVYRKMRRLPDAARINGGLRVTADPADILPDTPAELADGGVATVELNVCSMDDDVLEAAERRHTVTDTLRAVQRLRAAGLRIGARIHPGLPGSCSREILETGRRVADLQPDFVRIYPVLVLKGTALEDEYLAGRYRPLRLQEAVSKCKRLVRIFEDAAVPVARIGLQPAVDLPEKGEVVAGPHHPSLKFLVDAARAYERACSLITREFRFSREICLSVPPREEAALRGDMGRNVERLKQRFRLRELRIVPDDTMEAGTLRLEILTRGGDDVSMAS